MLYVLKNWSLVFLVSFMFSCSSFDSAMSKKPPEDLGKLSVSDLVEAGVEFGDETLSAAKKIIKNKEWFGQVDQILQVNIQKNHESWASATLINAVHLYVYVKPKDPEKVFKLLVNDEKTLTKQVAWHIAQALPSPAMAVAIDEVLTHAVLEDELRLHLHPKMADALRNNNLQASYTVARTGLFETHHVSFAHAMIALKPTQASTDFMDYLSLASIEELRQLNLSTVDVFVVTEILTHFLSYPVDVSHSKYEHLLYYGISRNNGLRDMARKVLERDFEQNSNHIAFLLSRMPTWIQISFVDGSRETLNAVNSKFLRELRRLSIKKEVVEEIDEVIR